MLKYYIEGLAMLTGYASWVLLIVAVTYSCILNRKSEKGGETDEPNKSKRS